MVRLHAVPLETLAHRAAYLCEVLVQQTSMVLRLTHLGNRRFHAVRAYGFGELKLLRLVLLCRNHFVGQRRLHDHSCALLEALPHRAHAQLMVLDHIA